MESAGAGADADLWIACFREAGTKPSAGDKHVQRIDRANESFMVEN